MFAFPRLSPTVLAVCPSYAPENVSVASVAVRSARSTSPATTVAQVATPKAERDRTNWLVQDDPAYSANAPLAPVKVIAEVSPVTVSVPAAVKVFEA